MRPRDKTAVVITTLSGRGLIDPAVLAGRAPLGRLGTPEEIAAAAVFLASDEAS